MFILTHISTVISNFNRIIMISIKLPDSHRFILIPYTKNDIIILKLTTYPQTNYEKNTHTHSKAHYPKQCCITSQKQNRWHRLHHRTQIRFKNSQYPITLLQTLFLNLLIDESFHYPTNIRLTDYQNHSYKNPSFYKNLLIH